jgi:hypothetical protein
MSLAIEYGVVTQQAQTARLAQNFVALFKIFVLSAENAREVTLSPQLRSEVKAIMLAMLNFVYTLRQAHQSSVVLTEAAVDMAEFLVVALPATSYQNTIIAHKMIPPVKDLVQELFYTHLRDMEGNLVMTLEEAHSLLFNQLHDIANRVLNDQWDHAVRENTKLLQFLE